MSTNTKGIYYSTSADAPITEEARSLALANSVPVGPNYLINGAFDFWQRGSSFTSTAYTADHWYCPISGGTVSSETSDLPAGFRYGIKYVSSGAGQFAQFNQPIETDIMYALRGKTVTVSGWVKITGSFSGAWVSQALYSTSNDSYSSQTTSVSGSSKSVATAATTSWTRFTNTFTIPSDAVGLRIENLPQVAQPSGVTVRMTGLQLEEGSVATPFRRHALSLQGEFVACQRYYQTGGFGGTYFLGSGNGTGVGAHDYTFTPMRVSPTITNTYFTNGDNASNGGHAVMSNGRVLGYYRNANTSYPYYNFTSTFKLEAEL